MGNLKRTLVAAAHAGQARAGSNPVLQLYDTAQKRPPGIMEPWQRAAVETATPLRKSRREMLLFIRIYSPEAAQALVSTTIISRYFTGISQVPRQPLGTVKLSPTR